MSLTYFGEGTPALSYEGCTSPVISTAAVAPLHSPGAQTRPGSTGDGEEADAGRGGGVSCARWAAESRRAPPPPLLGAAFLALSARARSSVRVGSCRRLQQLVGAGGGG